MTDRTCPLPHFNVTAQVLKSWMYSHIAGIKAYQLRGRSAKHNRVENVEGEHALKGPADELESLECRMV